MNGSGQPARRTTRQIIRSFQAKALKKRTLEARIADWATSYFGTLEFLLLNAIITIVWISINSGHIPGIAVFDPFPFILLTMILSVEAIILTITVLMSQNREARIATLRDELELQVNLLTEREITKALKMLDAIHDHLKIKEPEDAELESMLKATNISYIERKLEEQIRSDQPMTPLQVVAKPISKLKATVQTLKPGSKSGNGGRKEKR